MIVHLSPWTARCGCGRRFLDMPTRPLPSGIPTLARIEATCRCGGLVRIAYRKPAVVADDERRAADVRTFREVAKTRRGLERVAAEAVARHLGVRA